MSDPHTPDSLADALDAHLPPGDPRPVSAASGDPLVDAAARLAEAAPPRLSPDAVLRIEARVLQAQPIPQPVIRLPYVVTAAAALVVAVIAGAVLLSMGQTPQQTEVAVIATDAPTETHTVTPSSTPTTLPTDAPTDAPAVIATEAPTDTPVIPTEIPASDTPAPTATPTVTPTDVPPSATPAPPVYDGVVVRLQGPITAVTLETATVTVFDTFEVRLAADDPLLRVLRVGDTVKLSGALSRVEERLLITATEFALDNPDAADNLVETGPQSGDIWRDDDTCANPPPPWAVASGWRARCESGDSQPGGQQNVPPGQQNNPNSNRPDSPPGQSDNPGRGNPPDSPPGQANHPGQDNKPDSPPGQNK
jgi:hypothetical protein